MNPLFDGKRLWAKWSCDRINYGVSMYFEGLLTYWSCRNGKGKPPSVGIDKRTAFAYKKQAIEANLNMSLGFGANDTKCSEGSREICSDAEISQTALCLNLMCLLRSIASRL